MTNVNSETLLLVFVCLTGAAVLLQAFVLLAIFFVVKKAATSVQEEMTELRTTITPVLNDTKDFLSRVGPKMDAVATDLAELAHGLRVQGEQFQHSAADMMERVNRQTSRVDSMFTEVLNTIDHASGIISSAVNVPLKRLSAVAAFARAALNSLRSPQPAQNQAHPTHSPADKDLFV